MKENEFEFDEEVVTIPRRGISLGGLLDYDPRATGQAAILALSPHPRFGGDMSNNVMEGSARLLARRGYAVLRFDYHGVGASSGDMDPIESFRYWSELIESDAHEEVIEDASAALEWLRSNVGTEIHALGYSFGAVAALRLAAASADLRSVAAIAPAVAEYDLDFAKGIDVPVLAIHPSDDFATPLDRLRSVLDRIASEPGLIVVNGVDHFFRESEEFVAELAADFFDAPRNVRGIFSEIAPHEDHDSSE